MSSTQITRTRDPLDGFWAGNYNAMRIPKAWRQLSLSETCEAAIAILNGDHEVTIRRPMRPRHLFIYDAFLSRDQRLKSKLIEAVSTVCPEDVDCEVGRQQLQVLKKEMGI